MLRSEGFAADQCSSGNSTHRKHAAAMMATRPEQTRRALVQECTAEAAEAKRALTCFVVRCKRETARKAELVYGNALAWASDVVDGPWPSTHSGADRHAEDLPEAEEELLLVLADDIGMMVDELDGLARYGTRLGGTGKRY